MKALASKTYWSKTWKEFPAGQLPFSPTKPGFRDFHRLFQRVLEEEDAESLLEIGCYPGRFLWYFNQTFKLKVSGLEYIDWACQKSETLLRENGIEAELIHGDLFEADMGGRTWDIVASFGFIEHFTDLDPVLRKHLDLLKPGGLLLLTFPNHTGFNGRLFRWIDPERYALHSHISCEDVREALGNIGGIEILESGYYGRLGFWNCGLYMRARAWGALPFLFIRGGLALVEFAARLLLNSATFSPNTGLVVRKS